MKEITDWLDCIKIKNFCTVKENIKRMRRQVTLWGLQDTFDKVLLSKLCRELLKHNRKKTNNMIKKWAKELNHTPPKIQMTHEHVLKARVHTEPEHRHPWHFIHKCSNLESKPL